jgi:hypothetical protein
LERNYDPAAKYLQGVQIGASIQHQRNQLQAEADQASITAQARAESSQREAALESQKAQISAAYQQQQISLKQQQLQTAQQKVALETQDAARTFQAQQGYQSEIQRLMKENPEMDESEAQIRSAIKFGPMMGVSGPGMAAMYKDLRAANQPDEAAAEPTAKTIQLPGGQTASAIYIPGSKSFQLAPEDTGATTVAQPLKTPTGEELPGKYRVGRQVVSVPDAVATLEKQRDKLETAQEKDETGAMASGDPSKKTAPAIAARTRYNKRQAQIDALEKQIEAEQTRRKGKSDEGSDLPAKKSDLVKGKKYRTRHGVATWDGENFRQ